MEILSQQNIEEQTKNFAGKKYRKSIIEIQKILEKNELFNCSFVYELLIIQQKALTKLLNKNIFKKQPYSLEKAMYIVDLVNRNNSVLLYIVSKYIEEMSNFTLKQMPKVFDSINSKAEAIIQKIIDFKNLSAPLELFFENFLLIVISCINTLKRYDAYEQAFQISKFCYELIFTFAFPKNITIQRRIVEVKMIYGCILFQLGQYSEVKKVQDDVVNNIINILCSHQFVRYKEDEKKKIMTESLWRKLLVSIMVNLSSSIHSKNYQNISQLYKLFASAVRDSSRLESMTFRKCITYVLDSIGVILNQYTDVMHEMQEVLSFFFQNLQIRAKDRDLKQQNSNFRFPQNVNDEEQDNQISELQVVDLSKSKSFYVSQVKESKIQTRPQTKSNSFHSNGSKQRLKLLRGFVQKDTSFFASSKWKDTNFFATENQTLNYLGSISHNSKPIKSHHQKNLNRKAQFLQPQVRLVGNQVEQEKQNQKSTTTGRHNSLLVKKQSYQYSKTIKKQFQLKYRQSRIIQNNQDDFINIAQMKRNIKQTDKLIEYSIAEKNVPHHSNSSFYFENEEDCKQEGIALFVKTILTHKDFLGIPKLFQKHQMTKRKRQNINKKKMQKKHKSMCARRTSKFQNAQLSNILRKSLTNYVSNPRSKKPRNIRDSIGVIVNNRIIQNTQQKYRRPITYFSKQSQYSVKLQKFINHNYTKSQQIIKKFSSEIQAEIRQDQAPKHKNIPKFNKSQLSLSHKYYKLGKTVLNTSFSNQQK